MKKNILLILLGLVFVIGLLISNCQAQNEGNEASTTTEEVAEPPRRDHGVPPEYRTPGPAQNTPLCARRLQRSVPHPPGYD